MSEILSPAFFSRPTVTVAQELLGKFLLTPAGGGPIIETEAYHQDGDPACHAYNGKRTPRTASMYLAPGHLYVYSIHQVFCLNLVTETAGVGAAVLIRGLIPAVNVEQMLTYRPVPLKRLSDGPGKLCQALNIDKSWDRQALSQTPGQGLWLENRGLTFDYEATSRIGIRKGTELMWRFYAPPKQYKGYNS